jgi:hypothetical protein
MVIGPATPGPPASEIVVGLDIGQRQDYSAIAVLEAIDESDGTRDPVTYEFRRWKTIQLRHAERIRIGTPFAGVVDRVSDIVSDPRLRGCTLVTDATGVGAPVVEMLRAADLPCRLIAAQITGGIDEGSDGHYHRVPKRDLVVGLQVLFDQWPFEMARGLPGVDALVQELAEFKAKRSNSGTMRFSGARDDLTMALALAWWWMRKRVAWQSSTAPK